MTYQKSYSDQVTEIRKSAEAETKEKEKKVKKSKTGIREVLKSIPLLPF